MKTGGVHILLDQIAPRLADKLGRLPLDKSLRIVAQACGLASRTVPGLEPSAQELLDAIVTPEGLSEAQKVRAGELATAADDRYFTLKEQGAPQSEWSAWFEKARLLSAVSNAGAARTGDDILDAVYELCHSREDPSEIIAMIESEARD
jgi:hypothetical protein